MSAANKNIKIIYSIALAFIAWYSIALQLYLITGSISNFFSYFTILSNLLIAVSLTVSSFTQNSKAGNFFSLLSIQTAIALYIFIVSLVYNIILRSIAVFTGWQLFVNNMLHVVIPILYIIFWMFFRTKGNLRWKDAGYWILFPAIYLTYSLIRGSIIHWYPYPFLNAVQLGYPKVLLNVIIMAGVFLFSGLILILIARSLNRKNTM